MDNKLNILLLNLQKVSFKNDNTGEVTVMTKIVYGIDLPKVDGFSGYSILESYAKESAFADLDKYLRKVQQATVSYRPTSNGVKYVITKINDFPVK